MGEPLTGTPTKLYTTAEAAEILKVSYDWLKKQVSAGKVRHVRLGRAVRFTDALLDDIIAARTREPASALPVVAPGRSGQRNRL